MPEKASGRSSRQAIAIRGPLAFIILLVFVALGAIAFGIPDELWRQPGFAELRGGVLEAAGLVTPQPAQEAPPAGWYQVCFTDPRYPDRESDHHDGIDGYLVQLVAGAQHSVDVAAYELDLDTVADALQQAKGRGVAVRLVTDTDNAGEEAVRRLAAGGVPVVGDGREAIMHDKFVVVDGRYVWTGSWNLTVNCTYRNNNNAIMIDSPDLARNYEAEFAEMFEQHRFGPSSPADTPLPQVTVHGTPIESYFAPEDHVEGRIVAVLRQARRSIHFLAFSFTSQDLGQALIERARAGVAVSGVVEKRGSEEEYAQLALLRRAGLDVLTDGNPYVMHHKVFVVDEEIVITGSYNFSKSADRDNDENILIIRNPEIARQYVGEFDRVRQRAGEAKGS